MLEIIPISAFNDNYIWAIVHPKNHLVVVVDPGDATPVLSFLNDNHYQLTAILITHHHTDHVGGVTLLKEKFDVPVYGPANESIPYCEHALTENNTVHLKELGCEFKVFDCPGHTAGHIAYYELNHHWLFCGDTLFAAGCGRLFEGTPAQMHTSLSKFAALPKETKVFCGHEYTLSNLNFAKQVEPNNSDIQQRILDTQKMYDDSKPSLPSNIALELKTNPFMRCHQTPVIQAAEQYVNRAVNTPEEVLGIIRNWKDKV